MCEILINLLVVGQGDEEVELGDYDVEGVPDTADDGVSVILLVVGEPNGEMGFIDEDPVVEYSFTFESCVLECHIQLEQHNHIRSSCKSQYTFEVLPQEGIPRPRI